MPRTKAIAGVLIGGQSSRMGTCKALLRFRDATFIEHVVQVAQAVVDQVILLGHASLDVPTLSTRLRLADEPGFGGPLAGLVPLLEFAGDRWALLIACDMPLLDPEIVKRLLSACEPSVDAAAFCMADDEGFFPCCAVFHPRTVSRARLELARSGSLRALLIQLRCRTLKVDAAEAWRLRSFNTPGEYADLLASAGPATANGGRGQ